MGERLMTVLTVALIMIFGPYVLTSIMNGRNGSSSSLEGINTGKDVIIQLNGENYLVDVEVYIAGVLPGLIDWRQDVSLIEAQAVAVRTNIYYVMGSKDIINASELEYTYYTREELIEKYGKRSGESAVKVYEKAVSETVGISE